MQKEGKSVGIIPFLKLDGGLDSPCIILKDFFVYFKYYIYLPQPQMVISLSLPVLFWSYLKAWPLLLYSWHLPNTFSRFNSSLIISEKFKIFWCLFYYLGELTYLNRLVEYLAHCRTLGNVSFLIFCFPFSSCLMHLAHPQTHTDLLCFPDIFIIPLLH